MITNHKWRPGKYGGDDPRRGEPIDGRPCAWLGTCGRPREEHRDAVTLRDVR